jgi:cytochrome c-type biogenesis protein CcmF
MRNSIGTLGDAGLLLALIACGFAVGACVAGARRGHKRLIDAGIYGGYAASALIAFSSAVMWFAILSNDYSIKYVQRHSDASMPWYYRLTAFWGGLDGSIMWWVLLLALFSSVAIYLNREKHKVLIPYITAILYVVIGFFLFLIIFEKRPFDVFLTAAPTTGKGMNPLLQNPYMATHPPSLYLGFVSATVPFAFALAALITGNLDDSWLASTRRWMMVSWYFLGQGLVLGSLWAYEELGWGGYWGWDPVENSGFLPWLTATAFLHSIMIQERRGMMKVWNVSLTIVTFLLTIVGTFMTRSGIVQSVHAFGQDTELAIIFLIFMGVIIVFSFGYVIYRLPLLRGRNELDSWLSREFAFLINNWILLGCAFFILTATLFPTISEYVMHDRITVGAPFFNQWMGPVGLVLLFLTGVGPLIAWRKASVENLRTQFTWPLTSFAVVLLGLQAFASLRGWMEWRFIKIPVTLSVLCFALCAFTMTTIVQEIYRGTRIRQAHTKLDFFTSLIGLVARGKRRYGGYLVHVGVVLMFIGFAGNAYKKEADFTMEKGQTVSLDKYTLRYDGARETADTAKQMLTAVVTVTRSGKPFAVMHPAKWSYRHHEDEPPTTEVDIHRSAEEDLYVVLNGIESQANIANFKIVINPLVNWLWLGFLVLIVGTVIAFMPDRAYQLAAATAKADKTKAVVTALVLVFVVAGGGVARAQQMEQVERGALMHTARSDRERKLFFKYKCLCGTCSHSLDECESDGCGSGEMRRVEVQKLIDAGKTDDEINSYEIDKYGEVTLRIPMDTGYRRLVWLLPVGVLLGAVGMLVVLGRKWQGRGKQHASTTATAQADPRDEATYGARLDDELDELD